MVNNAGYGYAAAIEEGEDAAMAELFATNFTGLFSLLKRSSPACAPAGPG
jgi:NAD(P)-dependent dehydrogenase (short-subunit alcohol dehydrogenase family)